MAYAKRKSGGKFITLTTFEEAEDIASQLKAKGINNAVINLKGAFSGANLQYDAGNVSLISSLGTKEQYESLYEYVNTQQMKLLLDVGIITSGTGSGSFSSSQRMVDITGKKVIFDDNDGIFSAISGKSSKYFVLKPGSIDSKTASLLKNMRETLFTGFCINDASQILNTDYASSTSKNDAAVKASEAYASLATERTLAVKHGNFNTVKSANIITQMPSSVSGEESKSYVAVPFIQLIVHGTSEYTFEPINKSSDTKNAFLKCIEYGALPSYEWCYEQTGNEVADAVYLFDNSVNSVAEIYEKISGLNNTRSQRITGHSAVEDGVYLTEYADGTQVYVNYNDKKVEVNDIMIGAKDYVVAG